MGDTEKKTSSSCLTIVTTYYNQPSMLLRQLEYWKKYLDVKKIVVDDGSEDPVPMEVLDYAEVYRINEDIPWHQDQARNLGMSYAKGWCLLLDLDHVATEETIKNLSAKLPELDEQSWYRFPRATRKQSLAFGKNIYLIHNDLFWECGGYPPTANYGSDRYFMGRLNKQANYAGVLDVPELIVYLPAEISDASTRRLDRTVNPVLLKSPVSFTWQKLSRNDESLSDHSDSRPADRHEAGRALDEAADAAAG